MKRECGWWFAALVASAPQSGWAQETIAATPAGVVSADEAPPAAPAAEGIEAIVRGLYVEGRVGGGYGLMSAKLVDVMSRDFVQPLFGDRTNRVDEGLGPGAMVQLAVGYDLTGGLAIQGLVGAALVSGTRTEEPVRDLSLAFGGAGVRLAFDLTDRLDLLASGGVVFVNATNAVEKAHNGVGALGGVGLEYYVHVRHFSIGLDVSVLAPFTPMRLFLGISPTLKYTFN